MKSEVGKSKSKIRTWESLGLTGQSIAIFSLLMELKCENQRGHVFKVKFDL